MNPKYIKSLRDRGVTEFGRTLMRVVGACSSACMAVCEQINVKLCFHHVTNYKIKEYTFVRLYTGETVINAELRNDSKTSCMWPSEIPQTIIHVRRPKQNNRSVSSIHIVTLLP